MTKKPQSSPDNDDQRTLVEHHAYKRLNRVETELRKEYKKRPSTFQFAQMAMAVLLIIVLVMMAIPLF